MAAHQAPEKQKQKQNKTNILDKFGQTATNLSNSPLPIYVRIANFTAKPRFQSAEV